VLLAFDTATPAVTVALHDGTHVLAETTVTDARRHGELLASLIEELLAKAGATRADLTAVATGTGPGPYTGLRAGLVTARVLGSALGIPVYGVGTLDVIAADAAAAAAGHEFLVATDARRREVYWARYGPAGTRLAGPDVGRPADVGAAWAGEAGPAVAGGTAGASGSSAADRADVTGGRAGADGPVRLAAGTGPVLYPGVLGEAIEPVHPSAATLARLAAAQIAAGTAVPGAEPLYLRRPDAREPGPPKRVTA
jgi:tRNA threonylcarbamoyl adenosine modification protein YeaZ